MSRCRYDVCVAKYRLLPVQIHYNPDDICLSSVMLWGHVDLSIVQLCGVFFLPAGPKTNTAVRSIFHTRRLLAPRAAEAFACFIFAAFPYQLVFASPWAAQPWLVIFLVSPIEADATNSCACKERFPLPFCDTGTQRLWECVREKQTARREQIK